MRMIEPIEKSGYFWLPSHPEDKLPGTLYISEGGEVKLNVVGDKVTGLHRGNDMKRVLGIIEGSGFVTLDDCFCMDSSTSYPSGISKSTIRSNFAFLGVGYDESEEIKFSKLNFSVEGLDEWLGISGIRVSRSQSDKGTSVHYTPPENIEIELPNGMKLAFIFSWTSPGFPIVTEAKITQKAYISLTSESLRPIDDYLNAIFKISNFLCFAIDQSVSIDSVTGYSCEITQEFNGEKYEVPIKVYYESSPYFEIKPKIQWRDMLFRYNHIAGELENILAAWFANYEFSEPAFNLYFASKNGAYKFIEGRFLSLAQGIETLHRRNSQETLMPQAEFEQLVELVISTCPINHKKWLEGRLCYGNELPLVRRLEKMLEPFHALYGNKKSRQSFVRKVLSTRNYLTHYDSRLATQALNGGELWILCNKLEALFQLHFLRLMKISEKVIDTVVKENRAVRFKLNLDEA